MISQTTLIDLYMFYPSLRVEDVRLQGSIIDCAFEFQARSGEAILAKGRSAGGLLLLTRGSIRVTRSPQGNGRSVVLYRVMPGDFCMQGMISTLSGQVCTIDAIAESDLAGALLPPKLLAQLKDGCEGFRSWVYERIAQRFSGLIELVDDLAFGRLETRLARRLLREPALLQVTHQKIAEELGSAREVISRLLKEFENRGAIRMKRGQIEVASVEALRTMAELARPAINPASAKNRNPS